MSTEKVQLERLHRQKLCAKIVHSSVTGKSVIARIFKLEYLDLAVLDRLCVVGDGCKSAPAQNTAEIFLVDLVIVTASRYRKRKLICIPTGTPVEGHILEVRRIHHLDCVNTVGQQPYRLYIRALAKRMRMNDKGTALMRKSTKLG